MPSCIYDSVVADAAASAAPTMPARLPSSAIAHLAAGIELVDELVGVLHDAAADHDQLGPEHRVQLGEVRVEPLGPLLPREVLRVARRVGGPRVGDLAVHLEVAELGVRRRARRR